MHAFCPSTYLYKSGRNIFYGVSGRDEDDLHVISKFDGIYADKA